MTGDRRRPGSVGTPTMAGAKPDLPSSERPAIPATQVIRALAGNPAIVARHAHGSPVGVAGLDAASDRDRHRGVAKAASRRMALPVMSAAVGRHGDKRTRTGNATGQGFDRTCQRTAPFCIADRRTGQASSNLGRRHTRDTARFLICPLARAWSMITCGQIPRQAVLRRNSRRPAGAATSGRYRAAARPRAGEGT